MEPAEWTWRCASRLRQQWPNVDRVDLEHAAEALRHELRWSSLPPAEAAEQWLRQGFPEETLRRG